MKVKMTQAMKAKKREERRLMINNDPRYLAPNRVLENNHSRAKHSRAYQKAQLRKEMAW